VENYNYEFMYISLRHVNIVYAITLNVFTVRIELLEGQRMR